MCVHKHKKKYNHYRLISYIPPQTIYIYAINILFILPYNMNFTTIYRILYLWKNYKNIHKNATNIKIIFHVIYLLLKRILIAVVFNIPVILQTWAWYVLTTQGLHSYKIILDSLLSKITIIHQHREKPAIYIHLGTIYLNGVPKANWLHVKTPTCYRIWKYIIQAKHDNCLYGLVANRSKNATYNMLPSQTQNYITQHLTIISTRNIQTYFLPTHINTYKQAMEIKPGTMEEMLNKFQYYKLTKHISLAINNNHKLPILYCKNSIIYTKNDLASNWWNQ